LDDIGVKMKQKRTKGHCPEIEAVAGLTEEQVMSDLNPLEDAHEDDDEE
jgi:hypothetical protein